GPLRWMPPEAIDPDKRLFSRKSDVWSFGVVLWEMLMDGAEPFGEMTSTTAGLAVLAGRRLEIPADCPNGLKRIMRRCWRKNPEERPDFEEIRKELMKIYERMEKGMMDDDEIDHEAFYG